MEKRLNVDVAKAVTEFEAYMKEFAIRRILYRIIFRGKGLEFDSYRNFSPDDDANEIDWKASARANNLLVKQYIEERDLKIMFIIDVSDNMLFGSTEKLKCEYVAELSAALAHLILDYNDNIGFVFFSDKIKKIVTPKKGTKQFNMFVDDLSNPEEYGGTSEIKKSLESLLDSLDSSINAVFIISDFIRINKSIQTTLNLFRHKFETVAIMIRDPLDKKLPETNDEVVVEDPVTKKQLIINPSIVRGGYEKNALEQENKVKEIFREANIDLLNLTTDQIFAPSLAEFLRERIEKKKIYCFKEVKRN